MTNGKKSLRTAGVVVFFIGYLIGVLILGLSVMGDFESHLFFPSIVGDELFSSLDCPVMMDDSEVGAITATIKNPTDTKISPSVWVHISEGFVSLLREDRVNLQLQAGEAQAIQWTITNEDAAFGHWVLFKIFIYSQYPLPSSQGSCGVFTANFPGLTGGQVYILSITASGVLMVLGGSLWYMSTRPLRGKSALSMRRSLIVMGAAVSVGLVTTIIGSFLWMISGIFFIVCMLMILVFLLGV
ncbi:MAG: hypothetical protein PVF83_12385 [Anaerolineales bacterium]|jgi:hypothetical protein